MNPLYSQLNGQQNQNNPLMALLQLKQNPQVALANHFNIPQNMTNPNDILQYLLNTNQVSQQQVNAVMQQLNNPQIRNLFTN